jgi:hypothetical protein
VVWKAVVASRCYSHGSNNSSCSGVVQETKEPEGKHVDQEGEVVTNCFGVTILLATNSMHDSCATALPNLGLSAFVSVSPLFVIL